MIVSAYDYRTNPQRAIRWVNEVLAGSSTGCVEIRRHKNFLSNFLLNVATAIQRYFSGRCINCDANKVSHKRFLICPYCEMVPPRKR